MPLNTAELKPLADRVQEATSSNFPLVCADLFSYLDQHAAENSAYKSLEEDRKTKWAKWGPEQFRAWKMPRNKDDRESLAYDLFRSVAEQEDNGSGGLYTMYAQQRFTENVDAFRADFLQYLVDALNKVLAQQPRAPAEITGRPKQQKFGILDAPDLLPKDLAAAAGILGRGVIYFDLDGFKSVNSKYTERVVDRDLLPAVQQMVVAASHGLGYAYAEGGDEMVVFLPNATLGMSAAFADALRGMLVGRDFGIGDDVIRLSASFGVAAGASDVDGNMLVDRANRAKNHAKQSGKNCVVLANGDALEIWHDALLNK